MDSPAAEIRAALHETGRARAAAIGEMRSLLHDALAAEGDHTNVATGLEGGREATGARRH